MSSFHASLPEKTQDFIISLYQAFIRLLPADTSFLRYRHQKQNRHTNRTEQAMQFDQIIMVIALLSVAGILFWGVFTMGRGGEYNRTNSNKIMRYRIIFQALALLIFVILLWLRRNGNI